MTQLDLFDWADKRPSNVINSRWRFEAKVEALVRDMLDGRLPPEKQGEVIRPDRFHRWRAAA